MYTRALVLTMSALILAYGASGAIAQDQMTPPDQQQWQSHPMGHDMMGHGMMGGVAMRPHPMMMRIIFALIDTDSDGTISLQEFQAAHERIFKTMDTNKDGKLTLEEMEAFFHPQH